MQILLAATLLLSLPYNEHALQSSRMICADIAWTNCGVCSALVVGFPDQPTLTFVDTVHPLNRHLGYRNRSLAAPGTIIRHAMRRSKPQRHQCICHAQMPITHTFIHRLGSHPRTYQPLLFLVYYSLGRRLPTEIGMGLNPKTLMICIGIVSNHDF